MVAHRMIADGLRSCPRGLLVFVSVCAATAGCAGRDHIDVMPDTSGSAVHSADGGSVERSDVDPIRDVVLSDAPVARLVGTVSDAFSRRLTPARIHIEDGGKTEAGAVLGGVGFWSNGTFDLGLLPGGVTVNVTGGRRRTQAKEVLVAKPGARVKLDVSIGYPGALRFEEFGWFGADLFRPVARGSALRGEATLSLVADAARGEGVAYCAAAPPYSVAGWRTGHEDPAALRQACAGLSGPDVTMGLAWRGMDAPFYGTTFFLAVRSPQRLAPVGWDLRWPNFLAFEEARAQSALSVLADVGGERFMDPRGDVVALRPALREYYRDAAVALDGGAWELPFDVACGVLPDAVALGGLPGEEAIWFRLLHLGLRIPSVFVEMGSFGEGVIPAERTFVELGPGAVVDEQSIVSAVRAGRVMCTNGPFVFLTLGGKGPGAVVPADGVRRALRFEALSSTERGSEIEVLELVRNGVVVESVAGEGRSLLAATMTVAEREDAWYLARVRSGPAPGRIAWTNPVYVERPGRVPPKPVLTRVTGRVTESRSGRPLGAMVEARLCGETVATARSDERTGQFALDVSPAARLDIAAAGYATASARVFFHTQAGDLIRSLHTNAAGRGAAALADEQTYARMRLACAQAEIDVRLDREAGR